MTSYIVKALAQERHERQVFLAHCTALRADNNLRQVTCLLECDGCQRLNCPCVFCPIEGKCRDQGPRGQPRVD